MRLARGGSLLMNLLYTVHAFISMRAHDRRYSDSRSARNKQDFMKMENKVTPECNCAGSKILICIINAKFCN